MDTMNDMAAMYRLGISTTEQGEKLAAAIRNALRPGMLVAVGAGKVSRDDMEDVLQNTLLKVFQRLQGWNCQRGGVLTWAEGIMRNEIANYQRARLGEMSIAQQLAGVGIDLAAVVACQAIQSHPDALYEWEEQVGRWMCDAVVVDAAMLAKLRTGIMKKYRLKNE